MALTVRKAEVVSKDGGQCPCESVKPKTPVVVASKFEGDRMVVVRKALCEVCVVDRDRNQTEQSFWEANW